jgi:hypothetical protein
MKVTQWQERMAEVARVRRILGKPRAPGVREMATCGTCGRSWDDGKSTELTPVPSGRCPFEYAHAPEPKAKPARAARPPQSTADALLLVPLVDLRTRVDAMDAQQREAAERECAHLSQRAATLSAYIEHYALYDGAHDASDKTHNAAVKHAQRVTTHVRKALGYSYPKFEVTF